MFTAIIAEIMILAAIFVTATQLVMAQVEAMIVIAAAPIILAFGALSFTRDIATKVLSHALGTGVKVMTIYILAGVMVKIGPEISAVLAENGEQFMSSPGQLLEVIAIAGLMTLLAFFIPTVAGAMLSGQASLSGGSAITSTIGVAAGAAAVGAVAVGGTQGALGAFGNGATNALAGAGGIAQAFKAGVGEARDLGKTGLYAATHGVGEVGKQALGMATGGIGSALEGASSSFSEKMTNSTGGRIASAIDSSRGGSISAPRETANLDLAGPTVDSGSDRSNTPASGDASSASISNGGGSSEQPRARMSKVADVLGSTRDMLNRGKEHIIDDRAQVGASIDTKASY